MGESFAEVSSLFLVLSLMVLIFSHQFAALMVLISVQNNHVVKHHIMQFMLADIYTCAFLKRGGARRPPQSQHHYHTCASYVFIIGSIRTSRQQL